MNPEFTKLDFIPRHDLEFYVPQLCSFLMSRDLSESEKNLLIQLLSKACQANFFFAHRVFFFFYSAKDHPMKHQMLDMLEKQALTSEEQLYLANSETYIEAVY